MQAFHEHEWEAAPGLPEALPSGEVILWQGRPEVRPLALRAFHVRKVACYFVLMLAWQAIVLFDDRMERSLVSEQLMVSAVLIAAALLALWGAAWWSARTTLYTVTNRRVVMRIGIVLSVTFNLPFRQLKAAHLKTYGSECADIALELLPTSRIGWFHLWPHQRAWHLKHPQPTLRCLAHADQVAEILAAAWQKAQESSVTYPRPHRPQAVMLDGVAA